MTPMGYWLAQYFTGLGMIDALKGSTATGIYDIRPVGESESDSVRSTL